MWINTDAYGRIQEIEVESARMLGLSPRGAVARDLGLFFPQSFRFVRELVRAANYQVIEDTLQLYPRDRKPLRVRVRIEPCSAEGTPAFLRWTLERVPPSAHEGVSDGATAR